jgi:hypothetical protein
MQPSKLPRRIHALDKIARPLVVITDIWLSSAYSFANRLYNIKENHKFQKNGRKGHREDDPAKGLAHIVSEIKGKHELKYGVACQCAASSCIMIKFVSQYSYFLFFKCQNLGMFMYGMRSLGTGVE